MRWTNRFLLVLLLSGSLGFGCATPTPGPVSFSMGPNTQALFTFDQSGGSFCANVGLCLHIPEGAVDKTTEVVGALLTAPDGAVGFSFQLEIVEGQLKKAIRLELPVPEDRRQEALVVVFQDGQTWKSVPTAVTQNSSTREGVTSHLSVWTLAPKASCDQTACLIQAPTCQSGQTLCGKDCVDLQIDSSHCGACQQACKANETCQNGTCTPPKTCPTGETLCGGVCVNVQTDPSHCGACQQACKANETCQAGTCMPPTSCPSGETLCGKDCVDLQTNANHCGACQQACKANETCQAGVCTPSTSCPTGETLCGKDCVDLQTNTNHCGACQQACKASETCKAGTCTPPTSCPTGETLCGKDCVDLQTDIAHCGACQQACKANEACQAGACMACSSSQIFCNGQCLPLDESNCGACGQKCPTGAKCTTSSGTSSCECPANTKVCANACVDVDTSKDHCGACGNACKANEACVSGTCSLSCSTGQSMCSGQCVDLQTDSKNCGTCGNACSAGLFCVGGTCKSNWVFKASGFPSSVTTDQSGNIYVTGTFGGNPKFGSFTLDSQKNGSVFVLKMSPAGVVLWAVSGGNPRLTARAGDWPTSIAVDTSGQVYIAGTIIGQATFGNITVTGSSTGKEEVFVAKLNASGAFLWAKTIGSPEERGYSIGVDKSGNSFVAGISGSSTFVCKLDSKGTVMWLRKGSPGAEISQLYVDSNGDIVIGGWFYKSATFGSTTLTASSTLMYIAKLNTLGSYLWAKKGPGLYVNGLIADANNNYYVAGPEKSGATPGITLSKWSSGGTMSWNVRIYSQSYIKTDSIALDQQGHVRIYGFFEGTVRIGSVVFSSVGNNDVFVAQVDAKGNHVGVKYGGSKGKDYARGIACDNSGACVTAAILSDTTATFGSTTITNTLQPWMLIGKNLP